MVETRWTQGRKAFNAGIPVSENPYGTAGPAYREWRNGWYREKDEQAEIDALRKDSAVFEVQ